MSEMARLAAACDALLEQARGLVTGLDRALYDRPLPGAPGGVGAQLRHCLEFFACLLAGLPAGVVDYDGRAREARLEHEPAAALARIASLRCALAACALTADTPLLVRLDEPGAGVAEGWTRSTAARELRFLASHTVHHFAVIALLLRALGAGCPTDFGVAPATRAHRVVLERGSEGPERSASISC